MNWFYSLKIARRLMLLNLVAAVALFAITGFGIYQTRRVYEAASYSTENTVPSLLVLDRASDALSATRTLTNKYLASTDPQAAKSAEDAIAKETEAVNAAFKEYEGLLSDDKDRALLAADRALMAEADRVRMQAIALARDGKKAEAYELVGTRLADAAQRLSAAVQAHRAYNEAQGKQGASDAQQIISSAQWFEAGATVAVLVAVLVLASLVARSITGPLAEAVSFARRVAEGDLTGRVRVVARDETGQLLEALGNMSESLKKVVGQVRVGSETIATASSQIASGNLDLSTRTEQQASSLQQTASSMEELTSTVRLNAENAQQASTLAANAAGVAQKGSEVVGRVVDTMSQISDRSTKIADITGIIEGIAFQTNILALNAAVEAARAGEQGRGFAVVASEVRSLAQRSSSAAKEIKDLISASVQTVEEGSVLAGQAGNTMGEVTNAIARVTDIMGEIAAASNEQSRGIEQIGVAITQMDEVTQQNAALVEEAAAASQSLDEQGRQLSGAVAFFRVEGMHAA
ncbi:methyl-accepting chemotaxis protein [Trinickia caryophylli]|uniref:Methyl-accepting chemotaxis protein n=1 Tax=Trinickia caryophylli TaxID=28094 RepID=A0A1X7DEV1_TRICW|nr:methyl-accepting chemotaxis protein [Trinickia caryophylli]PMS09813.1 HAMP domain-containing protein [Trinickia caryophylli]TRX16881.1 HAMP domain-containing protein [Trinickia caryophylli]WQE12389.1 methyl-accepting chemotaxis protein [Trinickia caryophylli]SMF14238.1 methyl-accepting chemotaxis protein [Trinickia caryophylli]GLU31463.1 methyl-accepting chemotaxis protein [Trinickia caryophylli]